MTTPEFTVEYLDPETLVPSPANFRRHPALQREALQESLAEHGYLSAPIVNRTTGHILDGHARVELAQENGEALIPVRVVEVSEDQEKRILASFDRIGALAERDDQALTSLLQELAESAQGLPAGWADSDLEALLAELTPASGLVEGADEDEVPEPADVPTRCQPGDIWLLGEHKIGCLDCTDEAAVKRLLGDDGPRMVFADPPYGIGIVQGAGAKTVGNFGERASKPFGRVTGSTDGPTKIIKAGVYPVVIGDESTDTAIAAFQLCNELWPAAAQVWWGANHYAQFLPCSSGWMVWDKENTGSFGDGELAWSNQPRAVRIFRHMWNGLMKASERGEKRVHPTQKPVALAEWCFETYGTVGDVVFDPFLGSGMSVIAAEKTARRVVGCELSPEYCDVVLQRFENAFGRKARLQARSA